jgi:EAL domain-containing protein (putative c-di-GMP-specific phosphodiesterase class I)
VRADGGAIVGVESLLRWNHPNRGYIPPGLFVPVAEDAGLMDQLGAFVLRRALEDAARWPGLYVAVNLSPVQVRDRRFVDLVREVLAETKTDPSRVVLEITEGVLIDDPLTAKARLEDLRRLGVQLALDDFGSGYSSLAYLQRLPFDKLKIDRGFVAALDQSANTGVIIQAIVTLGRALGMSVLIEGVETEEQRVLLRLAGCNEMQGFLFATPSPAEGIDRLLAAGEALPSAALKAAG